MDPELVRRLRAGQREARDRALAERLRAQGRVPADALDAALAEANAGSLGQELVRRGLLEAGELERLTSAPDLDAVLASAPAPLAGAPTAAPAADARRVGGYVLVQQLGAGGMGEVWKAWDARLSRWVALKLLRAEGRALLERFVREARLVARLAHPGIPRVYEVDEQEGRAYLALELVEGVSLGGARLPPRRAAEVIRDAARAVQHAHDLGVVHRDLKPANLMESLSGKVSVLDFGLARGLATPSDLTRPGSILGTPNFMAPEQAQGLDADVRTDVYGLGATLYALLEGRAPFEGTDPVDVARRVAALDAPRLPEGDGLGAIVNRATARERRERFASAAALAEALDAYVRGARPTQPEPSATGLLSRLWARLRGR